jgi:CheY-like chemotaxis protein
MNRDRIRILIVDDEPDHRLLLHTILSELISSRLDLAEAENGQEALELFQTWHPNLILMDLWMPQMNGEFAIRQIRSLENQKGQASSPSPYHQPTRILAVTAATFECDRTLAFDAGCDDFICKPIDFDDFVCKLTCHLAEINSAFLETLRYPFWRSPLKPLPEELYAAS